MPYRPFRLKHRKVFVELSACSFCNFYLTVFATFFATAVHKRLLLSLTLDAIDNSDAMTRTIGPSSSLEGVCQGTFDEAVSVVELTIDRLDTLEDANIKLAGSNSREMDRDR